MQEEVIIGFAAIVGVLLFIIFGVLAFLKAFYKKVEQGRALIINTMASEPKVTFTGGFVFPVVHKAEFMDISLKTIELDRRGKDGLICQDNIRGDISVTFFVQVNKKTEDVLKVAQLIGCERASDEETIHNLFEAKFSEALKTAGKQFDFASLYQERDQFREKIVHVIGPDLNGFTLEDTAIDYLEQTQVELLDKENILDAQGIRKITEITAAQNVHTNELRQKERMDIGEQDLKADQAIFEFEKRHAEAEAKKHREIAEAQAKEQNAAIRIQDEESKRTMTARKKHEEEVAVQEEAKQRGVAIAAKGREREIAVETERVEKARVLEAIGRERETELGRINKDKEVEVQKKEIADIIRGRIAVDKTVAEEEERIKDLRVIAEAKRLKEAKVVTAEGAAQEKVIHVVKDAEASETAAKFAAKEKLISAEADLEAADKLARSQMRLAEGQQASEAATGLAAARVKEAHALALEKEGLVEVRVKEANAAAIEKEGLAQAVVVREKLQAEAVGDEHKGLADARVEEAHAAAIEKKLVAEAAGLAQKAAAMKALDGVGREHEEFRIRLEKDKEVEMRQLEVRQNVAHAQAEVMGKAMQTAKINIVGGDGQFFDRFIKAVTLGQSTDGMIDNSETIKTLLGEYLDSNGNGGRSLPTDIVDVLSKNNMDSATVRNLTISALLAKMMAGADTSTKGKLKALMDKAKEIGLE